MKNCKPALALMTVLLLAAAPALSADRTETVHFKKGAWSATLAGSIKGYDGVKYVVGARKAQAMSVLFKPDNASCYFNVLPPGSDGTAIFIGSSEGNEFARNLDASGDHIVQVYLYRNAARRNETCNYQLTIEISPLSQAAAQPASTDALVPGTKFHATSEVPCSRGDGRPTTRCKCGVVRSGGGTAEVTIFWPDGGNRVLFFEKGQLTGADVSQADGDAKVRSERQGDLVIAHVGAQRFEIPDAVVFGD